MHWLETMNETWIHDFKSETRQQSKQWVEAGGPAKNSKPIAVAWEVIANVFWNTNGIIIIDSLQEKNRIIGNSLWKKKREWNVL